MNDIEVTSIDLVEGGNVFKQGHYLTLGYVPRDENGDVVDFNAKTLTVTLWGSGGIVFESGAIYGDGVIRFTLNETVPSGNYQVEFTATSSTDSEYRKKFPTNPNSGRISVVESSDNSGALGISVYTVAQIKAEQQAAQTAYEGAITPQIVTLTQRVDDGVGAFTTDTEVIDARMGLTNLRQFNENITQQVGKKVEILNTEMVYTVGPGGQFTSINEALSIITNKYPAYSFNSQGISVTLMLKSGFIMKEQVFINSLDLSWISVKSEDAEVVIDRQFLNVSIGSVSRYAAWVFTDGAISPKIYVLFNMNQTGSSSQRNGFNVRLGSTILLQPGSGCKNAGGRGLHAAYGFGYANNTIFTGCGEAGIRAANGSRLFANAVDVSNSFTGLMTDEGYITARQTIANNCDTAISAARSNIDFIGSTANDCRIVLTANQQGEVIMTGGQFKRATYSVLNLTKGVRVFADESDMSGCLGVPFRINNSEVSARFANIVPTGQISMISNRCIVDLESSQIKEIYVNQFSNVNAKNTVVSSYVGTGHIFNLGGKGNTCVIEGSAGTYALPVNAISARGIVFQ